MSSTGWLETLNASETPEKAFEDLCALAAMYCGVPSAMISFLDQARSWSTTSHGVDAAHIEMFYAISGMTVRRREPLIISDTKADAEFSSEAYVSQAPFVRFYAAVPLVRNDGRTVGSLCVFGPEPQQLNARQFESLERFAKLIIRFFELRRESREQIESIERQQEFTNAVLENMTDGVLTVGQDGLPNYFNKTLREFFGADTPADILPGGAAAVKLWDIKGVTPLTRADLPVVRANQGELVKDFPYIMENIKGERRSYIGSAEPLFDRLGRKIGAVTTIHNVTELRAARLKTEASLKTLTNLIEASSVAIFTADRDLKITMWNASCERVFGWSREEVLGKAVPYFQNEVQRKSGHAATIEAMELRRAITLDATRQHRNGTPILLQIAIMPLLDERNEATGFMAILTDITARKERELKLAEANRVLQAATDDRSAFIATMSHEIRTPLNGIIGMTELLEDTSLSEDQAQYFGVIKNSAEGLLSLVDDILAFSDLESGKVIMAESTFAPGEVVEEVAAKLQTAAKQKGLKLKLTIPELARQTFVGDRNHIQRALLNIVSNAVKFTKNGEVHISVDLAGRADDSSGRKISRVRIEVQDTGIGIADDIKPSLFRAFSQADGSFTRDYGGAGLGLSLTKSLVDLMGGEIGFESEIGCGSTFWFTCDLAVVG